MAYEKQYVQCTMRMENCTSKYKHCEGCGFERKEAQRRKSLPLEQNKDGLWRFVIRKGGD